MRTTNQPTTPKTPYTSASSTAQQILQAADAGQDELLVAVLSDEPSVTNDPVQVGLNKQEQHQRTQAQASKAAHAQPQRGIGYQRANSGHGKPKKVANSHKPKTMKAPSKATSSRLGKFLGLLKSLGYTKGGKLSDVGVDKLKRHIVNNAKPALTDAQELQLEKGLKLLADVLPKSSAAGKELGVLVGLVRSGKLDKLGALSSLNEVRSMQKTALAAMVAKPNSADQILALTQRADFKALTLKGNEGLATQKALLVAMGMGKDGAGLLAQGDFKKLPVGSQLMMAQRLSQVPEFQAKDFPKLQKSLKAVYSCLKEYKEFASLSAVKKETAAQKMARHIQLHPYMLKMMTPAGQMSVARALLEQLGNRSHTKGFTEISEALAAIKEQDPALYKGVFGTAAKAILKGTEGWKNLWAQIKSKRSDAVATVVSAASNSSLGVLAGVIDGASAGKSAGEKLFNAYTNGVVGALGATIAGAGAMSAVVGLGPGVVTALWSHYCDSVVGAKNRTELQAWLKQPRLTP